MFDVNCQIPVFANLLAFIKSAPGLVKRETIFLVMNLILLSELIIIFSRSGFVFMRYDDDDDDDDYDVTLQ